MKLWYKKIIYSTWFLALFPAVFVMLFIKPAGMRYTLEKESNSSPYLETYYSDLNSDSISEVICSVKGSSYYFVAIKTNDNRFYDQWNLEDSLDPFISGIFTGDYDHDKFSEVYLFSYENDSLFLNINEVLDPEVASPERIFITKIARVRHNVESFLYPAGFFDKNNDGYGEFYFSISSAFNHGPRKVYSYDIRNRKLDFSPVTNIIPYDLHMADADNDSRPEIFGALSSSGNFSTDVPYSDSSTWFMVFNDDLEFEFKPVEFMGFANALEICPYNRNYAVLHWAGGIDARAEPSKLMLFTTEGQLLKSRLLSDLGYDSQTGLITFSYPEADRMFLTGKKICEIDGNFDIIRHFQFPFTTVFYIKRADVNNDGRDEFLAYSREEKRLLILDQDLKLLADASISAGVAYGWKISYYRSDTEYKTVIQSGDTVWFLKLLSNNFYYLSFLKYPGIYLAFVLFIALIRRINTLQVVQKEDLRRRLLTLQLQGIKSQLDPHFTFNTLNSVASLIYLEDRQNAYDYLNKFTQLMRIMINDADKIYRYLGEEIDFVSTYFELEKLRFGEKFNYKIVTGEGVTQREKVPKLVLHTFAENAIKHGIIPRTEGGFILININKENDYLRIVVEDNGIGRRGAMAMQQVSTGKGLKLTGEFYDILNRMNNNPVTYKIHDLYDPEGNPAGTRVVILVPEELDISNETNR